MGTSTHIETYTNSKGLTYDTTKMMSLASTLTSFRIRISLIRNISRTLKSGFCEERYQLTDPKWPIFIDEQFAIVNGRHRVCRAMDDGQTWIRGVVISPIIFEQCFIGRKDQSTGLSASSRKRAIHLPGVR